jgi:fatty-acyl-CoA synthase
MSYEAFLAAGKGISDEDIQGMQSEVQGDDVAYLLYTSGSTARPKGVMLLHKHLIGNMFDIGQRLHFSEEDVCYMPLSLFWGMGCMNMLLGPWTHGMHIVLQEHFDATEGLDLIQSYRCTVFAGTANIIHAVFQHPDRDRYDLTSIRKGTPLGAPAVSRDLMQTVMPLGVRIYGLTESHGFATMHDSSDPLEKRASTDGRLMPGFELRIVSPDTGAVLGPGEVGEVRLRGRIMKGYYKDPLGTENSFDRDGFFKTGDIGKVDSDGYLLFMGRYKEMLKTGGINVSPIEVEEVLLTYPGVREAFVTGLPDPVREQIVAAVIVLEDGAVLQQEELIRHCRTQLASYKVPRRIRVANMDDVPQTSTRKVNRLDLARMFEPDPVLAAPGLAKG